MSFRIIGKFGFLLVIMGFFMPIACDMNAFQLVEYLDSTSTILLFTLFTFAIIGVIIGVLLLMRKDVPIIVDWIIIAACIGVGIGLMSKNELELQYGAYVIMSGIGVPLIAQIISLFLRE